MSHIDEIVQGFTHALTFSAVTTYEDGEDYVDVVLNDHDDLLEKLWDSISQDPKVRDLCAKFAEANSENINAILGKVFNNNKVTWSDIVADLLFDMLGMGVGAQDRGYPDSIGTTLNESAQELGLGDITLWLVPEGTSVAEATGVDYEWH